MGVFNVRENVRNAMKRPFKEFEDINTALSYIDGNLKLSVDKFIEKSDLLQDIIRSRQTTLDCFY